MAASLPVSVEMNLPLTMRVKGPSPTSVCLYQFICQQKENKLIGHNYFDSFQNSKVILVSHAIYTFLKHHVGNVCETHPVCASVFSSDHHGMARPQFADGGTASDMEGSCE
jgi:hypothetical protein